MADQKWFDGYTGQSTEELIALHGQYRTDSLVAAFEQAVQQKAARIGAGNLSAEERVILAVEALEREVNNGGYGQFFLNSPEYIPTITDALRRIGCSEIASLTEQAIDALELTRPAPTQAVAQMMAEENEERDEKLSDCDNRYYELAADLAGPLFEFIKSNKDRIRLPG